MSTQTIGVLVVDALVMVSCLIGCGNSIDTGLDRKDCGPHGECLPGWTCSDDHICVRPSRPQGSEQSRPISSGRGVDAGGQDDAGSPMTCENGLACDGRCVDSMSDIDNCGACGLRCLSANAAGVACRDGACVLACKEGFARCKDGCYRLSDDIRHCGGCGRSCPPLEGWTVECAAGTCQRSCTEGLVECGGACVNLDDDPNNCGECGLACEKLAGASTVCSHGTCVRRCDQGLTDCGGACVDTKADPVNCGTCGTVCPVDIRRSVPTCADGTCNKACQAPYVACEKECVPEELAKMASIFMSCTTLAARQDRSECQGMGYNGAICGGVCVDTLTDAKNCGWCGLSCGSATCVNGFCWGF